MYKIKVGVLGATGAVGQRFIQLLENHPWFEVDFLLASNRSSNKKYKDAVNWKLNNQIPEYAKDLTVYSIDDENFGENFDEIKILFSGLDSSVALEIEQKFVKMGKHIVSNSKNHRMFDNIPLLIPEINHEHIKLIYTQKEKGKIITNPNCSTTFFTLVAGIINKKWPIEAMFVVTMQAISGAGYPGLPSYDILDNVIPYIGDEEEKMEIESLKILGTLNNDKIDYSNIKISTHANRVSVIDGHLESVSIKFKNNSPSVQEIKDELSNFISPLYELNLPSAYKNPVQVLEQNDRPQTRVDRDFLNGMGVSVGRIRKDPVFDIKMTVLGHNTIKGAAGGAILNAELFSIKYLTIDNI
jgi:aspartate-semialdehyde dehydrogenase